MGVSSFRVNFGAELRCSPVQSFCHELLFRSQQSRSAVLGIQPGDGRILHFPALVYCNWYAQACLIL